MYKSSELKTLLCFDMETVPDKLWNELSEDRQKLWKEKYHFRFSQQEIESRKRKLAIKGSYFDLSEIVVPSPSFEEVYTKFSPLIAEFGRIWCISFGVFNTKNEPDVSTLLEKDEKVLIQEFIKILNAYEDYNLNGYNIAEFDIPFLLKRMWIHGITDGYPKQLQLRDAKPWTTTHIDLMNDWKSLMRESVSLGSVCLALDIPTPKDKFNNDEFVGLLLSGAITDEEGVEYCEKDVVAVMLAMKKLSSITSNYLPVSEKKVWAKK